MSYTGWDRDTFFYKLEGGGSEGVSPSLHYIDCKYIDSQKEPGQAGHINYKKRIPAKGGQYITGQARPDRAPATAGNVKGILILLKRI